MASSGRSLAWVVARAHNAYTWAKWTRAGALTVGTISWVHCLLETTVVGAGGATFPLTAGLLCGAVAGAASMAASEALSARDTSLRVLQNLYPGAMEMTIEGRNLYVGTEFAGRVDAALERQICYLDEAPSRQKK